MQQGRTRRRSGANNYILIVLDSCRYDSFQRARPRTMKKLGPVERRWSYASWTSPSHFNLLMGLLPHASPKHVFASQYYTKDFFKYNERLGTSNFEFSSLAPQLYLPPFLKGSLGYDTHAMVSLPVLNSQTILNYGFDTYKLMPSHNDMRAMVREIKFSSERPQFYLLNVGETHYPYALPGEPPENWPRVHGVHGVFKHLDEHVVGGKLVAPKEKMFSRAALEELRHRQLSAVRYLDRVVEELFELVPKNTYITITSDHGELFGEDGYFGHGPVQHEKVFEVFLVEGKLR
jgi:hypothetical protein